MKFYVAVFVCLISLAVAAQQSAPAKPVQPSKGADAKAAPPAPPADSEEGGQPTNIRLDVTVTDQAAQGAPLPKSLMVMLVDRAVGRTRAAFQDRSIAVDARPVITNGRIRMSFTIQSDRAMYLGPPKEADATIAWRNSFSLLLDNGKPMIALETVDAATKQKMSIEVKATIQK
jgi:hypothetical protein